MHSKRFAQMNKMGIASSIKNNERAEGGKPPKKPTKSSGPNKNSRGSKSSAAKKNTAKLPAVDSNASKSLATNSTAANKPYVEHPCIEEARLRLKKIVGNLTPMELKQHQDDIDEAIRADKEGVPLGNKLAFEAWRRGEPWKHLVEDQEGGDEQDDEPKPLVPSASGTSAIAPVNVDNKVDMSSTATEGGNGKKKKAKAKEGSKLNPKNWPLKYWIIAGFVLLLIIAVVAVVVCIFVFKPFDSTSESKGQATTIAPSRPQSLPICTTPTCNGYATALTANVNNATQPCNDFHEYACGSHDYAKDKVSFIGADQVKALIADTQATNQGLPKAAKMLRDACESGSFSKNKMTAAQNAIPSDVPSNLPEDYVENLAKEGYTNFGVFKLDMSRFMDPNEINPKAVIVIQDRTKYDSSKDFGFKDIDKDYNKFKAFDESNNVETTDNELVPLADIKDINDVKKKLLINVLTGWFPVGTPKDFMLANVYTYKYPSWTTKIDASVDINNDDTKVGRILFHNGIAKFELEKEFRTVVYGEKDCHALVAKMLPQALAKFDNNNVDQTKEGKIKGMVEEYKVKQVEMLKKFNVVGTTRTTSIDKVKKIKTVVGFPKEYSTNMAAGSSVQIDESKMNDIYKAYPEVKKHQVRQHFAHLAKPKEYPPAFFNTLPPSTIYNRDTYTLYVTPRLLDDKLLDEGYPSYVKHGGVGVVIGKAVADVVVLQSTKDAKYQKSAQCFEKDGKDRANDKSKQDELVADHMGATSSYQMAKKDGAAPLLAGFESNTNDQMYFLSMAQTMCSTPFDGFAIRNDADGFKNAGKDRINKLVANMPEFVTAFTCPAGAQMHKAQKCKMY